MHSASKIMVVISLNCTKFSEHVFPVTGPSIWNALPQYVCDSPTLLVCNQLVKETSSVFDTSNTFVVYIIENQLITCYLHNFNAIL